MIAEDNLEDHIGEWLYMAGGDVCSKSVIGKLVEVGNNDIDKEELYEKYNVEIITAHSPLRTYVADGYVKHHRIEGVDCYLQNENEMHIVPHTALHQSPIDLTQYEETHEISVDRYGKVTATQKTIDCEITIES